MRIWIAAALACAGTVAWSWIVVRRRRSSFHDQAPVSPKWLVDHAYDKYGDRR